MHAAPTIQNAGFTVLNMYQIKIITHCIRRAQVQPPPPSQHSGQHSALPCEGLLAQQDAPSCHLSVIHVAALPLLILM
jgi:hypothetical protein